MPYTGPAANVANWIKNGANAAAYTATGGVVTVEAADVAAASGTIIKLANYGDDIRDFLTAVLDSVYKVYSAQTGTAIPATFKVQKALLTGKVQFVVTIDTNGDIDFSALA